VAFLNNKIKTFIQKLNNKHEIVKGYWQTLLMFLVAFLIVWFFYPYIGFGWISFGYFTDLALIQPFDFQTQLLILFLGHTMSFISALVVLMVIVIIKR